MKQRHSFFSHLSSLCISSQQFPCLSRLKCWSCWSGLLLLLHLSGKCLFAFYRRHNFFSEMRWAKYCRAQPMGLLGNVAIMSHLGKVKSLSFNWLPVDCPVKGTLHLKPTHAPPNWPIWAQTGSVIYSLALTCSLGWNIQRGQNM